MKHNLLLHLISQNHGNHGFTRRWLFSSILLHVNASLVFLERQKSPFSTYAPLATRWGETCYGILYHCEAFATSIHLTISIVIDAFVKFLASNCYWFIHSWFESHQISGLVLCTQVCGIKKVRVAGMKL